MDEIKDTLRHYILTKHLPGERPEHLRNDTALQSSAVLDSLALLDVVTFIEETYRVQLDVFDTAIDRFDTLEQIETVILTKSSPVRAAGH